MKKQSKWIKQDLKYNWHPYTQMKECEKLPPILIESAQGIKLFDENGKFYYDTISSWWCNVHGHNHPIIKAAIKKQLDTLEHVLFAGFTHKGAIQLAEQLVSITPKSLTRVFFSDNGSTAVETALKMSFQYWQNTGNKEKIKFVALDSAYHGDTVGTMSISGVDLYNEVFSPLFLRSFMVPTPNCYRCPAGQNRKSCKIDCLKQLETLLKHKNREIAALILEPLVLGAGGMIVYPKEYLAKAAKLAKKYNVHLILDEVATGFGRTGKMFAAEHANVQPDFMCVSKGITAGYLPMGATLTTEKIYKAFYADVEKRKTFYHGHTYTANPLACAAALASLEVFKKEKTLSRAQKLIPFFHQELEKFKNLSIVGDVRALGMIGALELTKDKISKEIYKEGLKQNLLLRPLGKVIYFFLPLCIKKEEIKLVLDRTYNLIHAYDH
ncbi:MAG: adenosylmethionine--8-amino-7-oxononanoate transaminase [Candidatus Margulisbacteria bacterium]|nr:adenosylmethionine--8-amino-7-oxononanoate transaminase [Candidatus Margulisiibacteriota bacterium]MBU1021208.1 adenosylmethionine--8-amino-7-oxononanoate transaminase [Candidatus Margulisiibacteriota bacterium]MBU1729814.1 adenosylmethionine--8-amino-7-oxononanoate transaminase [Candidatus Margulisiibacteriota bacterium]MBU1955315.1 adenosylmethionine--8-amino-7-oxononanoate transaminase [Candidatus Margulisiibacteriota bacterium]